MRHGLPPRPPEDGDGPIIRPLMFWVLALLLLLVATKCGLKAQGIGAATTVSASIDWREIY